MGALKIKNAEYDLLAYLRPPRGSDEEILSAISDFVEVVHRDPSTAAILVRHGVTPEITRALYLAGIQALLPEPWIKTGKIGGIVLVPTLWFMEPFRLDEILSKGWSNIDPELAAASRDRWPTAHGAELRFRTLLYFAEAQARVNKAGHDEAHGTPNSGGGCVVWLALIGGVLGSGAVLAPRVLLELI
jgi:hypothetical protein